MSGELLMAKTGENQEKVLDSRVESLAIPLARDYAEKNYPKRENGTFEPAWRGVNGEKELKNKSPEDLMAEGYSELSARESVIDIANQPYNEYSEYWKEQHRGGAEFLIGLMDERGADTLSALDLEDEKVRAEYGDLIHENWISRNKWVKDTNYGNPKLACSFAELSPEEQQKDIDQLGVLQKWIAGQGEGEQNIGSDASSNMLDFSNEDRDKVVGKLLELGYDEQSAMLIPLKYGNDEMTEGTLLSKIENNHAFFKNHGYSQKDIIMMTTRFPEIFHLSSDNLKKKIADIEEIGYSHEDVLKMTKTFPNIYGLSIDNLKQKIASIEEIGFSYDDVIKMTKASPRIFSYSLENIKNKILNLEEMGYSREDSLEMIKDSPSFLSLSIETFSQKISSIENLGYSRADVLGMIKKKPNIIEYSIEKIKDRIDDMEKLGYSREDAMNMVKTLPSILGDSIDSIKEKIANIEEKGYSRSDILQMSKSLPAVLTYSLENMREKLIFYDSIGMHELAIVNPKYLMQSVSLAYARHKFLTKEMNMDIGMENYTILFIPQKKFEKRFGYNNEEIKQKYPYEEVM